MRERHVEAHVAEGIRIDRPDVSDGASLWRIAGESGAPALGSSGFVEDVVGVSALPAVFAYAQAHGLGAACLDCQIDKDCRCPAKGRDGADGIACRFLDDIRIGHPGTRVSQPEINAGVPSVLGHMMLTELMGLSREEMRSVRGRKIAMIFQDAVAALTDAAMQGEECDVRGPQFRYLDDGGGWNCHRAWVIFPRKQQKHDGTTV